MLYSVKITSSDNKVIEIGKEDVEAEKNLITNILIHIDTVNDNVVQKSNAMLAKIQIFGDISNDINEELLELFKWSKDLKDTNWYRTVEITINTSNDTRYRKYIFENVFVVDYKEIYTAERKAPDSNEQDHFELYLTQKENNFGKIEAL